jgi:hypothetical protein
VVGAKTSGRHGGRSKSVRAAPVAPAYRADVGELRCVDGSLLGVAPLLCRDRGGAPFEITLELRRDGRPFGAVGERCGYFLATLAARLAAARTEGSPQARQWPDPDDRFPDAAARATPAAARPGERELFTFRRRDRGDVAGSGELRCSVRTSSTWVIGRPGGRWELARRAIVEAWGSTGSGIRAVLTSGQLAGFLADVLAAAERSGASYQDLIDDVLAPGHEP